MKYINADELKKALYHLADWENVKTKYVSLSLIFRAINEEPAADVVEVVRCKDCKYSERDNDLYVCRVSADSTYRKEDCFCNYGERRESE